MVSRLLSLCTRDESKVLEEISDIKGAKLEQYDIIFLDEDLAQDIEEITDTFGMPKIILFSNTNSEVNGVDIIIQKPFLPSQIIDVLDMGISENINKTDMVNLANEQSSEDEIQLDDELSISEDLEISDEIEGEIAIFDNDDLVGDDKVSSSTQVLDSDELEKIKSLLEMDDEIDLDDNSLSDEELEQRKIDVIKEQLIADGLEIIDEEEIVKELSAGDEIVVFSVDRMSKKKSKKKKASKKKKSKKSKKKKSIAFTQEELERIEDAVQVAIATLKRKQMKKLLKGKEIEVTIKLEDEI